MCVAMAHAYWPGAEATVGAIARAADRRSIVWEETLSEDAMPGNDTVVNSAREPLRLP